MLEKIKQLDKKMLCIICGIIILPILIIIVLMVVRGCSGGVSSYSSYEEKMLSSAKKYFKNEDKLPTVEGEKVEVTLDKLVKEGYIKSAGKSLKDSTCEGSVTVQNNGVSIKNNEGGYYFYSVKLNCKDYSTKTLKDEILKDIVTEGAGLYQVGSEYIFKGKTDITKNQYVNNYVEFYGKLYRIIKIDESGDLKLVRSETQKYSTTWDTKYNEVERENVGENVYSESNILTTLVKTYNDTFDEDAKAQIVAKKICVGPRDLADNALYSISDCSKVLENQVISLLSIADFANASIDKDCNSLKAASCGNYNYMNGFLTSTWTLTSVSNDTYNVYWLNYGVPYTQKANKRKKYNIVIYISGNITEFEGDGSVDTPYKID